MAKQQVGVYQTEFKHVSQALKRVVRKTPALNQRQAKRPATKEEIVGRFLDDLGRFSEFVDSQYQAEGRIVAGVEGYLPRLRKAIESRGVEELAEEANAPGGVDYDLIFKTGPSTSVPAKAEPMTSRPARGRRGGVDPGVRRFDFRRLRGLSAKEMVRELRELPEGAGLDKFLGVFRRAVGRPVRRVFLTRFKARKAVDFWGLGGLRLTREERSLLLLCLFLFPGVRSLAEVEARLGAGGFALSSQIGERINEIKQRAKAGELARPSPSLSAMLAILRRAMFDAGVAVPLLELALLSRGRDSEAENLPFTHVSAPSVGRWEALFGISDPEKQTVDLGKSVFEKLGADPEMLPSLINIDLLKKLSKIKKNGIDFVESVVFLAVVKYFSIQAESVHPQAEWNENETPIVTDLAGLVQNSGFLDENAILKFREPGSKIFQLLKAEKLAALLEIIK